MPNARHAPEQQLPSPGQLPPHPFKSWAWWDMGPNNPNNPFVWPVGVSSPSCVPSQLLVKINPIPAESRTQTLVWAVVLWEDGYMLFFSFSTNLVLQFGLLLERGNFIFTVLNWATLYRTKSKKASKNQRIITLLSTSSLCYLYFSWLCP